MQSRSKNQKKAKPDTPRNRYMRGARLSEYRLLKVLRGFGDERTAAEVGGDVGLSEKRTRELYDHFRGKLMRAVLMEPFEFGWAGYFLFDGLEISSRGHHLFDETSESDAFKSALIRQAPRSGAKRIPSKRFSELLFEITVRMFCSLSMTKDNASLYPQDAREAFAKLQMVALFIDEHKDAAEKPDGFEAIVESFDAYMKAFPILLARDEFGALVAGYRHHRFANDVLYDGLRRHLLKSPIGGPDQ